MKGRKGPALLARKENVLGAVFPVTFLFYFFSLAWVILPLPKFSTPFDHVGDRLQNYIPPCRSDGHVHLQISFLKWPWTSPPSSRSVNESAKTRASFPSLSRFKSRQVTAWPKCLRSRASSSSWLNTTCSTGSASCLHLHQIL